MKNQFSLSLTIVLAAVAMAFTGCLLSKTTTVTPGGTGFAPITNTVVTVNQANLALDCAALQLVGTPAVTYALQKNPSVRPILVDIQTALNGALNGADTNVVATIEGFVGNDPALDDQLTPLIQAASDLRGQLLAKYGDKAGVQISTAILKADLNIVTAALKAIPAP
jgi:hypothetical protein